MGMKLEGPKKYLTPAPSAYKPENSEKYLEKKIQHSLGIKPSLPKPYLTPAPNHYEVIFGTNLYLEQNHIIIILRQPFQTKRFPSVSE